MRARAPAAAGGASLAAWNEAWRSLGCAQPSETLYRELIARWSEPHRHYHALAHLDNCLATFESARHLAQRPGEVALGLWFHDAIYEIGRPDNEERSADWARDSILEAGLGNEVAGRVHALVMATKHDRAVDDPDAQLLLDIDLSTLGADADAFDTYDRAIRLENPTVPEAQFRERRCRILGSFLARPRIFATAHFHDLLEARARENISRAIERLSRGP